MTKARLYRAVRLRHAAVRSVDGDRWDGAPLVVAALEVGCGFAHYVGNSYGNCGGSSAWSCERDDLHPWERPYRPPGARRYPPAMDQPIAAIQIDRRNACATWKRRQRAAGATNKARVMHR